MKKIEQAITRAKSVKNIDKDKDFAPLVGLSPSDFSNRKKRDTLLPFIVEWGINENVNLNWLLKGEGEPFQEEKSIPSLKETPVTYGDENAELLDMTREVLESDTPYAAPLASNIRSFHRAVAMEQRMERLEGDMEAMRRRMEEMQKNMEDQAAAFKRAVGE